MENVKAKRMALLVGCNYPNTKYELHGCINDVVSMQKVLVDRLGFEPMLIELIADDAGSNVKPTGVNIMKGLNKMVDEAKEGDILFFHYSGHGTLLKKHYHTREEAIVPCDFNLITDVDFRQLVKRLPKGATLTILSDSCHSGGLIDKEKEQIGPNCLPPTAQKTDIQRRNLWRPKMIPYESLLGHLASLTNMPDPEIGPHLTFLFGDKASPKFRLPDAELNGPPDNGEDSGILLSGCQSDESSMDVPGEKAHGAFSSAVESILEKQSGPITNKEVVAMAREVLKEEGIAGQHPCLYCSDHNVKAPFLLCNVGTNKMS